MIDVVPRGFHRFAANSRYPTYTAPARENIS
jgi:hypothetical protein